MGSKSSTGLVATGKSNTTLLASIKDGIAIDEPFIDENRVIKKIGDDGNDIHDINIVNANKTSIAKFKDLIKVEVSFFTSETRLTFIKTPILHYFDLEYYIWIEIDTLKYDIGGVIS